MNRSSNYIIKKAIRNKLWSSQEKSKISPVIKLALLRRYSSPYDALLSLFKKQWSNEFEVDPQLKTKDHLFDLILLSIESMDDIKDEIQSIYNQSKSMNKFQFYKDWSGAITERALIDNSQQQKLIKNIGMAFILRDIFKYWLDDSDTDQSGIMSFIDRRLSDAQSLIQSPIEHLGKWAGNRLGDISLNIL